MEGSEASPEKGLSLEQQSIREYLKPTMARKGGTDQFASKLADRSYRLMYAKLWEETVREAQNIDELHKVMALGYDPHQSQDFDRLLRKQGIDDYRKCPEYNGVKKSVAQKLSALSDEEIRKDPYKVENIFAYIHPNVRKPITITDHETRGRWPFKKTVPVQRTEMVFRPYKELILELMNPQDESAGKL